MKKNLQHIIDSGLIELSVVGMATAVQDSELMKLAAENPEVQQAKDDFERNLEKYIVSGAVEPSQVVKPMLMAIVDYQERLRNGEAVNFPPELTSTSSISVYEKWLSDPEMNAPATFDNIYAKIIGATEKSTMAIVWIKDSAPKETHSNEYESFLIIEGTCTITIGHERYLLRAGDYFSVPLFKPHQLKVTSSIPCKAILQRIRA